MSQTPKTYYFGTTLEKAAKIAVIAVGLLNFNMGLLGLVSLIVAIFCLASPSKNSYTIMKVLCYVFAVFQAIGVLFLLIGLSSIIAGSVDIEEGHSVGSIATVTTVITILFLAAAGHNYYAAGICSDYAKLLDGEVKAAPQVYTYPSHPQYPTQMPYSAPVQVQAAV